jgi:EF hand
MIHSVRLVIAVILMIAMPVILSGQPPTTRQRPGDASQSAKSRFGGKDPIDVFDDLSHGKEVVSRSELDGRQQRQFDRLLGPNLSSDSSGVLSITRQEFVNRLAQRRSGSNGPERSKASTKDIKGNASARASAGQPIDSARASSNASPKSPMATTSASREILPPLAYQYLPSVQVVDPRPVVLRAGRLPPNISAWFDEIDLDRDGQVGLYEWVKFGFSPAAFREFDLNDDGLITPEEAIKQVRSGMVLPALTSKGANGSISLSQGSSGPRIAGS